MSWQSRLAAAIATNDELRAERDTLAARLAAVEAALTHAEQLPDAGGLYHDVTYRDGVEHTVTRLRAALATDRI